MARLSVAIVGAGWAGLAAAIEASRQGAAVTLYEMAAQPGGRARSVTHAGQRLDNGQHIAIGAYRETLRLMADVGVREDQAFLRMPLSITDPAGVGLQLRAGAPLPAFVGAVLRHDGWPWSARFALLKTAAAWRRAGFHCDPALTVADLAAALPDAVQRELIAPLCVAALNTCAQQASAQVFLRVLGDALLSGPGSADLLLPRRPLGDLLPLPALAWLERHGATLRLAQRVAALEPRADRWLVDGTAFDRVVVACPAPEVARLVQRVAPAWSRAAAALQHEPIITLYLESAGAALPKPMLALHADEQHAPAQFVFDRGRLGGAPGQLAFVISGAGAWVERGRQATLDAVVRQANAALGRHLGAPLSEVALLIDKRATFRCTPGLQRPPTQVAAGLAAAGDYIEGPYPATLEGAIRSGFAAARAVCAATAQVA